MLKNFKNYVLLFLVIAFIFCGCIKKKPEADFEIRVAFWGSPEEFQIIRQTVDEWAKKNKPDFEIDFEHIPWGNYLSKIITEYGGGAAPDVIAVSTTFFPAFYEKNVLLSLEEFIKNDKEIKKEDFFSKILNFFSKKNQLYVLPRDIAPVACIYYNKKIFDQEGIPYPDGSWTWSQFAKLAQQLTKYETRAGKKVVSQYGFFTTFWNNFVLSSGNYFVNDVNNPTKSTINKSSFKKGIQFYYDLIYKYKAMPSYQNLGSIDLTDTQLFMTGRVAMLGSGIWLTPEFRKITGFDWDIALWPKTDDGVLKVEAGGSGYGILNTTKHPKEAWLVVKALAQRPGQKILARTGLAQPAVKEIAYGPDWAKDLKSKPHHKYIVNDAVKYVVFKPFAKKWTEIEGKYIYPSMDRIVNKLESINKELKDLHKHVNEELKSD